MAAAFDIQVNNSMDLLIVDGDFVIDESDKEHIKQLLVSNKGNWKRTPLIGAGTRYTIASPFGVEQRGQLENRIQIQLLADGYDKETIDIEVNNLNDIKINAERV